MTIIVLHTWVLRNFHCKTRNLFVLYPNHNTELLCEWNKDIIQFAGKSFYELYIKIIQIRTQQAKIYNLHIANNGLRQFLPQTKISIFLDIYFCNIPSIFELVLGVPPAFQLPTLYIYKLVL